MIKRFKKLWKLSKKDQNILDKITSDDINKIPDEPDGKAVFFGAGTDEEHEEMIREDNGMDKWYKRILS